MFPAWLDMFPTQMDMFPTCIDLFQAWIDMFPTSLNMFPASLDVFPAWLDVFPNWHATFYTFYKNLSYLTLKNEIIQGWSLADLSFFIYDSNLSKANLQLNFACYWICTSIE